MVHVFARSTTTRCAATVGIAVVLTTALYVLPSSGFAAIEASVGTNPVVRMSTATSGSQANGTIGSTCISDDGRYVAFESNSSNLTSGDTNNRPDVFVKDAATGILQQVSASPTGVPGDGESELPAISSDGRFVAFDSASNNLLPGKVAEFDVLVRDMTTGALVRASADASGVAGNGDSYRASISADGRYVAFESEASNLVPNDTNSGWDVFVKDMLTGEIRRVSTDSSGAEVHWGAIRASISADARYVAFEFGGPNLVPDDTNQRDDVFVKDLVTGETTRVSVHESGAQPWGFNCWMSSISDSGRFVAFVTRASLVAADTNGLNDVYVRDRIAGTTQRVSTSSAGTQGNAAVALRAAMAGDRYVTFSTDASNLVPGDTNGCSDVFVKDLMTGVTRRVSTGSAGGQVAAPSLAFDISATGRYVAFASSGSNLVAADTNGRSDIFRKDALFLTRVAGNDRFDTAARLARKGWDPTGSKAWTGVKHVIVANGESGKEADPIGAAGLAGAYNCPVLLTAGAKLPSSTRAVITEIALKNPGVAVHLIGGKSVVPEARWNEIKAIRGVSATLDRVSGDDRYLTSAAIANAIVSVKGAAAMKGFILIAADNPSAFFDALAVSPFSYANTMPMLSVRKGSVPAAISRVMNSAELKAKPRYAASSATYIGAGALSSATRMTTSSNRYAAARDIASFGAASSRRWASPVNTGLAAGLPDALAGGAFLGKGRGVMLFTDSSKAVQAATKGYITAEKRVIEDGWVIGGTTVLPTAQEASFRNLLN